MSVDVRIEGAQELEDAGKLAASERKRFLDDLGKESERFGLDMVRRAKRDYLSGPRSLNRLGVVTGRLRSSIASDVVKSGDEVEITVGTNVKYAPAHELGFDGTVNVPAHTRIVNKVFGRTVRSHSRKMFLLDRPFLSPARADALPPFEAKIAELLGNLDIGGN